MTEEELRELYDDIIRNNRGAERIYAIVGMMDEPNFPAEMKHKVMEWLLQDSWGEDILKDLEGLKEPVTEETRQWLERWKRR